MVHIVVVVACVLWPTMTISGFFVLAASVVASFLHRCNVDSKDEPAHGDLRAEKDAGETRQARPRFLYIATDVCLRRDGLRDHRPMMFGFVALDSLVAGLISKYSEQE